MFESIHLHLYKRTPYRPLEAKQNEMESHTKKPLPVTRCSLYIIFLLEYIDSIAGNNYRNSNIKVSAVITLFRELKGKTYWYCWTRQIMQKLLIESNRKQKPFYFCLLKSRCLR